MMITKDDINIRDPFFLREGDTYYMVGSEGVGQTHLWGWETRDFTHFSQPRPLFGPRPDFWGKEDFWAPELYHYGDAYYLFVSFKAPGKMRGAAILKSGEPLGAYTPWCERATPEDWMCLDGTLYVDGEGQPYLVFCREWVEIEDGRIYARRLKKDLSAPEGEPVLLFAASQSGWAQAIAKPTEFVTDGPFLFHGHDGKLYMLWSSFTGDNQYTLGIARSKDGTVFGPWDHLPPLYNRDGGHGMVFETADGERLISIHGPNGKGLERLRLLTLTETDGQFTVTEREIG